MDDRLREQYDALNRATGMDIFNRRGERGEPGGYKFTCPGVAIGSPDVHIDFLDGLWRLSYTEDTRTYSGQADNLVCAYLALIADRMGYTATFEPIPEDAMRSTPWTCTQSGPCPIHGSHDGPLDRGDQH